MELTINQKFRDLLDLPSESERKELESQLVRDGGPRDPITVWKGKGVIIDGHTRYGICTAHGLKFKIREVELADEAAAEDWILENQLARRNLSPDRMTYFIGMLYNKTKQTDVVKIPTPDGKSTAETLAERFGVSEKTVRRAGETQKAVDLIGKVKGLSSIKDKLAAISNKNEGAFSKAELSEIGRVPDPVIAEKAVEIMIAEKAVEAKKKASSVKPAPAAPAPKAKKFQVAFSKPAFDSPGFNAQTEAKPALAENAMCYIMAADEDLPAAMELMKKWGLTYEASFIFKCDGHEGTWSDIVHTFLLAGSKGIIHGPKKVWSSIPTTDKTALEASMIKMIDAYHPNMTKLDMRKSVTAEGWEGVQKAQ
jgi:hypothetical protein